VLFIMHYLKKSNQIIIKWKGGNLHKAPIIKDFSYFDMIELISQNCN